MSTSTTGISDKWIRASIIGTIWAAAEIVLGSFLHNLRVPFSGNILTAIGLVILISASHKWREHGLYWRAGIVCALMKTMSPSAVIFGPMIAITAESLLLESGVRLFGRTAVGYITGSMLAMSWNLVQKIISLIIFYGRNLVDLYANLTSYAASELNLRFDTFWVPLVLLLVLYALFGAFAGVIGIRTGRKILKRAPENVLPEAAPGLEPEKKTDRQFSYSIAWLAADVLLMAGSLVIVSLTEWMYWIIAVVPAVTILLLRYKRAMRQLSRPGFWIAFVIITMLSALAFTAFQPGKSDLTTGILTGIQMNIRAVIIITGFSALGTELYNPKIRSLFSKTHFKQVPLALELAAASLPSMIADMPDFKTAVKDPVSIIARMMARVEKRLAETNTTRQKTRKVFIVTGEIGEGKTTMLGKLVKVLKERGIATAGILAPRIMNSGVTTGYDVLDISTGERTPFLRLVNASIHGVERFSLAEEGYQAGLVALDPQGNSKTDVIIIDEAGPLELRGEGWSGRIRELLAETEAAMIITVRRSLVKEVIEKFGLNDPEIIEITASGHDFDNIEKRIIKGLI